MSKFFKIVAYEYTRHVFRRRFLFALLSLPGIIAVIVLVAALIVRSQTAAGPLGFVDLSGTLADPAQVGMSEAEGAAQINRFASEAEAHAALEAGEIGAYYLLPEDYPQDRRVRLVYEKPPKPGTREAFEEFVTANLLADQPEAVARRLSEGPELVVRSLDGRREMSDSAWFNILVPFAAGLLFMLVIFTSSGYLMQDLVEEKENRGLEVLITSVTTGQLMSGKIIGIIGVGLTQLLVWIGAAALAIVLGRRWLSWLEAIKLDPAYLGLVGLIMIPSFIMVSALMAAAGATVADERESQQMSGFFTLPVVAPFWFTYQLMSNPNGPLALAFSYFPLTAPIALTMRAGFTYIPPWQLALNLLVLFLFALGSLWLAGRAFRLGLLRYGQRVSWRELFGRQPGRKEAGNV